MMASIEEGIHALDGDEWKCLDDDSRVQILKMMERLWSKFQIRANRTRQTSGSETETDEELSSAPPKKKKRKKRRSNPTKKKGDLTTKKRQKKSLSSFPIGLLLFFNQRIKVDPTNPKRSGTDSNKRYGSSICLYLLHTYSLTYTCHVYRKI